ncbi:MAG: hypothetical protein Q4G68_07270 [Planctomycetia bacterium]|nr:hypothetical protein [Planctomycetia bacterium]
MNKEKLRFSHIGIPTADRELPIYAEGIKVHLNNFADEAYNVEWLRFEPGSPLPEILKTTAHVAYEVDDLDEALQGEKVIVAPFEGGPNLTCAFIEADGYAVELMKRG